MIEEAIVLDVAAVKDQTRLWIKQEEEACTQCKVVGERAGFYNEVSIILQEGYTSLECKVVHKGTIFRYN